MSITAAITSTIVDCREDVSSYDKISYPIHTHKIAESRSDTRTPHNGTAPSITTTFKSDQSVYRMLSDMAAEGGITCHRAM
ncbi:MAG: hypothetical protein U9N46_01120, partial [Euryarchaeota archaeon]|nr:hypothetical protein [Euryarchaeota archaeon]